MSTDPQEELLYQLVKQQLGGSEALGELDRIVKGVAGTLGFPNEVQERLVGRLRSELAPPPLVEAAPRLLVDWGELPQVGSQCRPEFTLLCPVYDSRPEIAIRVDRDLDHDPVDPRRRPLTDELGLWSFHVPFRMTSEGFDCRPGQYLVDVQVSFREIRQELPRFYRCSIRLTVSGTGGGGELVIDGDGQSVVNLQGYNLKQFSKVILKGGQDGVINLQNGLAPDSPVDIGKSAKPVTTFEYQLKVDQQKQSRMPKLATTSTSRAYLDAAAFFFEDGRRTIVMTRPKITFGRSRDNDAVLRFLPPGEEHDSLSKNISRTHFVSTLTPEGIELEDESKSGMELNYSVVEKRQVLPAAFAGDPQHLKLGVTGLVPRGFELDIFMFAPGRDEHREELEYWDELYCEVVRGRLSRTSREALDVGINGVRYDRIGNLEGEECYAHLLRELLIGSSPAQCGVLLKDSHRAVEARLLHIDRSFWLEALPGGSPLAINGTLLPPRTLLPLSPGMEIRFGNEHARFDRPAQLYLD
jgi:hypothetical protein